MEDGAVVVLRIDVREEVRDALRRALLVERDLEGPEVRFEDDVVAAMGGSITVIGAQSDAVASLEGDRHGQRLARAGGERGEPVAGVERVGGRGPGLEAHEVLAGVGPDHPAAELGIALTPRPIDASLERARCAACGR